jgi:hypothetical protein
VAAHRASAQMEPPTLLRLALDATGAARRHVWVDDSVDFHRDRFLSPQVWLRSQA